MIRASILGMGQVSALGVGVGALRQGVAGTVAPPSATWVACGGARVPVLLARVTEGAARLSSGVDQRQMRRLDGFSQRAILSALSAIDDAGIGLGDLQRVGVLMATGHGPLATSFGFLDDVIVKGDGLPSPTLFSNSVHNAAAGTISSILGTRGPVLTVTGFALAWQRALGLALHWLQSDAIDIVLLCSGDEFHPILGHAVSILGEVPDGGIRPLEFDVCSYVPGETFTTLLLGRESAEPRWGFLAAPRSFRGPLPDLGADPVFLCAQGEAAVGKAYRAALQESGMARMAAHSALWGANPTADALTVLAAAVTLVDTPGASAAISCCSLAGTGEGVVVRVTSASSNC